MVDDFGTGKMDRPFTPLQMGGTSDRLDIDHDIAIVVSFAP